MIQWGIIGFGRIAERFMKGLSYSEDGKLYGVASRTKSKLDDLQAQHPQIHTYDNYEDMLNDDNIDAVYIALRHQDHYHWAKEALLRNKAVLCEKPATLSYAQTKELCDLSKQKHTFFMEAMKTRFIPMTSEIKQIVKDGVIGDITRIENAFCSDVPYDEKSYLFEKEQGGAWYDVSIYNIATILDFIKSPIKSIDVMCKKDYGVDVYDRVEVLFESGQTALIECAIDRSQPKSMTIYGTKGKIEAEPFYRPTSAVVSFGNGESFIGEKPYMFDDFYGEIEAVHESIAYIREEHARMSHQDSLDCMKLMEMVKEKIDG
ncbi:MAG: Gfo/Idh/MocA family oxidoreductase [Coprobacillus sp.]